MTKTVVTLDDKYTQADGQVMLSSLQGVVRLLLDQARRDRAAGLNTAGYVSGYRGSPITTLDAQLWAADKLLDAHDIRFEPGLNEELAATSLRGTQQLDWFGQPRVEGVFSLWYAKGVGVDRACEALKLGNMEGTSPHGGVLVLAGDDHAAKSSASAHQSEHTLIAGFMPVLYPATTDEILQYGQLGWALSRASGLYTSMKTITDTLDLTSTVRLPAPGFAIAQPALDPAINLHIRPGMTALQMEALTVDHRLPAAQAFAVANALDRVTTDAPTRNLTIVSAGKAWLDVCQALLDLGLDAGRCAALGIRVVKIGMVWPLEPDFARNACSGSREVLVVEEKRPLLEEQLSSLFYRVPADQRPELAGKRTPQGAPLLSSVGVLDAGRVRRALLNRLDALGLIDDALRAQAARLDTLDAAGRDTMAAAIRPAYFCSGCPHNSSTVVPEGSSAMGATGCHGLAAYMPERRTLPTVGMGSEGMPWVAAQSFVDTPHMFQNLGDGTYTHSGLLTIRASVAAKSNVTFKILYNDAVAMTGGQPAEGALTPEQTVRELVVEGVEPVILVSEDPSRFASSALPVGVRVLHRDALDQVQRELRMLKGTSAIVYEQTCANEKRRRRKRGDHPDPDMRLFINAAVCEGCGDCSKQSNCLSIQPVETEFGRKRMIDQSSCNKDFSCIKGFCPSFVTISGGRPAKRALDMEALSERRAALPEPVVAGSGAGHAMLVTGIGGTGVLTVGAVLAMAAHLEGKTAKVLDMTGMAQKGGAVTSHIRIARDVSAIPSARLGTGQTDMILACDLIVATAPDVLNTVHEGTRFLGNADVAPTGEFQTNAALDLAATRFLKAIEKRIAPERIETVRAAVLATRLLGDAIFTNQMMVGFAAQKGLLPVSIASIEEAIRLNGVAVKANLDALALGRLAAHDPEGLFAFAETPQHDAPRPQTLATMVESRAAHLTAYQNAAYAGEYRAFVDGLAAGLGHLDAEPFLIEVARQLARLMAYKDEYEVARLYVDPAFMAALRDQFDGDFRLSANLAPPLISRVKDAKTGRPKKIEFGPWIFPLFRMLAKLKGLRGTMFDPFGYTAERRTERALIDEYRELISDVANRLTETNLAAATEIAAAAGLVAGYGAVKEAGVAKYRTRVATLVAELDAPAEAAEPVAA
ncbi:indolepyruvate ferredoxin oxidoreductase family protein [Sphingomonas cavernae]|uniref:Indolepyruvate ferredoxin oxidoreductase family protein n=1 Tax=Sphingomonas cavernae TaxID=2320861 RepID=A0A418WMK0_9SPHN|nr:indolepyruvate ferredoxin oxidoreductase family protein [Sphingomonas cavernae]RJF91230.1 indolepyruvate ferredoxin oxidoreductase family protein [Sphingomonas cavernae]